MTVQEPPGYMEDQPMSVLQALEDGPAMRVHVVSSNAKASKKVLAEFSAAMTWNVPESGTNTGPDYVCVANRRLSRSRLRFWIMSISDGTQVRIGNNPALLQNGGGMTIVAAAIPFGGGGGCPWDSQQPLYATCDGGTAVISSIDESYAAP